MKINQWNCRTIVYVREACIRGIGMPAVSSSLIFIFILCNSCTQPRQVEGPPGYDLSNPQTLVIPGVLKEVSGIAFNNGNADTMYTVQDEEGKLFYFPTNSMELKHSKFGKKGDYEDIGISNGMVAILRSDGVLYSFPVKSSAQAEIIDAQEYSGLLPAGEYEGIYADENSGELFVLCKACNEDKATKNTTGFILQMQAGSPIRLKGSFQLNSKNIAEKTGEKKILFRPSALTKNPRTKEWYVLSSVNKLLVIADEQWMIKEVYPLNAALFNQPEGIAFDKENNLYISNERALSGEATILKFNFTNDLN